MKKTSIFLLVMLGIALAWEGYSMVDPNDDVAMITEVMRELPDFVILAIGVLLGHFFWCDCD